MQKMLAKVLLAAAAGCLVALSALADDDPGGGPAKNSVDANAAGQSAKLRLWLDRDPKTRPSYAIIVNIAVTRPDGQPWPGLPVSVAASEGTAGEVQDNRDGSYTATVTPPSGPSALSGAWSGEVKITARIPGTDLTAERTAVVLPVMDPGW